MKPYCLALTVALATTPVLAEVKKGTFQPGDEGNSSAPAAAAVEDSDADADDGEAEETSGEDQEGESNGELAYELFSHFDDGIFPALVISSATMTPADPGENQVGDPDGNIGMQIAGVKGGDYIRLEISGDPYIKSSVYEGYIPEGLTEVWVTPKLKYDFEVLRKVTQTVPANISAKLMVNDAEYPEETKTLKVHSINEVVFGYQSSEDDDGIDYSYLFAGFVNETHPLIDQLLKESLESKIVPAFLGYQAGDPDIVYAQAFAIWNTLQRKGIRYSDITTTGTESDHVYSQHVRFLEQSVDMKQANCVDGSVLFASALRKIGIKTFLVLVPGHMFVGWYLDEEGTKAIGLETTMLGDTDLKGAGSTQISEALQEEFKNKESFKAFNAAVQAGTGTLNEHTAKFSDPGEMQYQIIDIAEARKLGVTPISYR